MTEQQLWKFLSSKMKGKWLAQRHEDRLSQGIPDVSFSIRGVGHGWMELKAIDAAMPAAPVRIPHLTDLQRAWIMSHGQAGGGVFVLVSIGEGIYLFDYSVVYKLGLMTSVEMRETAAVFYQLKKNFDSDLFLKAVSGAMNHWRSVQADDIKGKVIGAG